ncbi:MAG: alpha/beta hydrolase [Solirubrobacterales bacterium]
MNINSFKSNSRLLRYTKGFIIFLICILIGGFLYEYTGNNLDMKKYQPPGQVVTVNGHVMHVFGGGSGDQTIVFASGNDVSCPYVNFYPLYNELSKYAKIAVYDRTGTGWSESTKAPRDIDTIVDEIHSALEKSGQKPPYIFVAHSLGSLEAIRFTQKYKNEIRGLVFIDAGNPEYYKDIDVLYPDDLSRKLLKYLGIQRLLFQTTNLYLKSSDTENGMKLIPKELQSLDMAVILKNKGNDDEFTALKNINSNAKKVLENGKLGDIPIRIFTAESTNNLYPKWSKSQIEFKNWSSDSKQIVVSGSKHYVHLYSPDIINKSVIDLINQK